MYNLVIIFISGTFKYEILLDFCCAALKIGACLLALHLLEFLASARADFACFAPVHDSKCAQHMYLIIVQLSSYQCARPEV